MKFGVIAAAALAVAGSASAAAGEIFSYEKTFGDWPEGCAPKEVGVRIVKRRVTKRKGLPDTSTARGRMSPIQSQACGLMRSNTRV